MAAQTTGVAYSSAGDSIATLTAIGIVAAALADMTHEVLGHAVAAWLLGVRILSLSTVAIQAVQVSRGVAAAGTIANVLVGALALVIFNRARLKKDITWFLWIFAAFNLLNSGYLLASALLDNGDWAVVIGGLAPGWAWRCGIGVVGVACYAGSLKCLARSMSRLMKYRPVLADLRRGITVIYLAGGVILTLASVFNPISPKLILISGIGPSFALSAGLLAVPRVIRRNDDVAESEAPSEPLPLSYGWLGAGLVVGVVFVAVFGPGLHFRA